MATDQAAHNRQGYRRRIRTRVENTCKIPQNEEVEVDIMTAEETREQLRQEYIRKQEEHIRENLESELVDHVILMFTGRDFLSYDDFVKSYRTEAISFMSRFDIITPSIQLKTIVNTLDTYIEYRHQILNRKVYKNKTKQTWFQWLRGEKTHDIIQMKDKTDIDRALKMDKIMESYNEIKKYKQEYDDSELTLDFETILNSAKFTINDEITVNKIGNGNETTNTDFTKK